MRQREIHITPGQFGWLVLGLVFAVTGAVQVYLFFATTARWPAAAAVILAFLAAACVRVSRVSR